MIKKVSVKIYLNLLRKIMLVQLMV